MSYCVNCGVKLAKGELVCPLCDTVVNNPNEKPESNVQRAYPERLDEPRRKSRKKLLFLLVMLTMLIPVIICMFADHRAEGKFGWSLIVAGGEALLFVFLFAPFLFKRYRPVICAGIDSLAVMAYVYFAELVTGGDWFWPIGFPISLWAGATFTLLVFLFTRKRHVGFFIKIGSILAAAGAITVIIELTLNSYFDFITYTGWSFYSCVPCFIMSVVCFVLHFSDDLKDKLRRRFII